MTFSEGPVRPIARSLASSGRWTLVSIRRGVRERTFVRSTRGHSKPSRRPGRRRCCSLEQGHRLSIGTGGVSGVHIRLTLLLPSAKVPSIEVDGRNLRIGRRHLRRGTSTALRTAISAGPVGTIAVTLGDGSLGVHERRIASRRQVLGHRDLLPQYWKGTGCRGTHSPHSTFAFGESTVRSS